MLFYDTCSLLDDYQNIFKDIVDNPFVISNITFTELEQIKSSKYKPFKIMKYIYAYFLKF